MKKLLFFWKELMATFWFVPVLTIFLAIALSAVMVLIDNLLEISQDSWSYLFLVNSPASARSILATISSAMIGVAGTVFSITLVALTLASSQFGPRLIRNFMYVRLNQIVLGSYISTYLYCLLILSSVKSANGQVFIPSLSILLAVLAAISNIILLIVFIHQIAISIQADHVISDISDLISQRVQSLFPKKMGDKIEREYSFDKETVLSLYQNKRHVLSAQNGYLQYIDSDALLALVAEHKSLFLLEHRPGSFLVEGGSLGILYSNTEWEEADLATLLGKFILGKTKTSQQDLEFSIHQMVEIAARALSPGVNDPYTAITCIDNLSATMCYLAQAQFPSKYRVDEEGHLRILADVLDFEGVLDVAFNQIRQFSEGSTAVIIRLVDALLTISNFTEKESQKEAVIRHANMILRLGKECIKEQNDLDDLKERVKLIMRK